jgi:hypothetical protein
MQAPFFAPVLPTPGVAPAMQEQAMPPTRRACLVFRFVVIISGLATV